MKNNIYPCIWFDSQGDEAAKFYMEIFGEGKIMDSIPVVTSFELSGQKFMALNGGPMFKPNPAVSFMVIIEDKATLEKAWDSLLENGTVLMPLDKYDWSELYGWVQDKYGVSWQLFFGNLDGVHGQKFVPTLMFTQEGNGKAEEAMNFYLEMFQNSKSDGVMKHEEGEMKGMVMHGQFIVDGYVMMIMDGGKGHNFSFSEGNSFVVECETQEEIDYYWNKFADVGNESMCGWVQDKYGVWWQVVPKILLEFINNPDTAQKVTEAYMKMKKFDIEALKKAAE